MRTILMQAMVYSNPGSKTMTSVGINRSQVVRLRFAVFVLCVCFIGYGYRFFDIQILRHDELLDKATQQIQIESYYEPRRGEIKDSVGRIMATTVPVKSICADPTLVCSTNGDYRLEVANVLSPILGISRDVLFNKLTPRPLLDQAGMVKTNKNGEPRFSQYAVLARNVRIETWQQISNEMVKLGETLSQNVLSRFSGPFDKKARIRINELKVHFNRLGSKAVFAEDDWMRYYPNHGLAAHVLGFVQVSEDKIDGKLRRRITGKDGVEFVLNNVLTGVGGWRVSEKDNKRNELTLYRKEDVEARPGHNVILTIDLRIQDIVERAIYDAYLKNQPVSISALVVEPASGAILAMANYPSFDPNDPGKSPIEYLRNRVITDMCEPGSTFKIVVVSAALEEGVVSLSDSFDCERGRFYYAGKILRDHERYGVLSVKEIITKSSNIGAAKVGIKLGQESLYEYIKRFGFGEKTGIPLPGEAKGIVHELGAWTKLSISRIPMGHEVAVTPLQMVMAMCAIANGGVLMRPMLISRIEDENRNVIYRFEPQPVRRVCSVETSRKMVEALKTVVSTNGTASHAQLVNYNVAGKTGTAQKAGAGGYLPGKYFSSFIGFFPADSPRVCIAVFLDEPRVGYYGGQVAAPVFKRIAEDIGNYLVIPPDKPLDAPVMARKSLEFNSSFSD